MEKRIELTKMVSIDKFKLQVKKVSLNLKDSKLNILNSVQKEKINFFLQLLQGKIEAKVKKTKQINIEQGNLEEIYEDQEKLISEHDVVNEQIRELLIHSEQNFENRKQEWLQEHKDFDIQEDKLQILEEEQKDTIQFQQQKINEIHNEAKPKEQKMNWEVSQLEQEQQRLDMLIKKQSEMNSLHQKYKLELQKQNSELNREVEELHQQFINIEEVPKRKMTDLNIFQENYQSFQNQIQKKREKKEEQKRKFDLVMKKVQNSRNYEQNEMSMFMKYKDNYEIKRKEKRQKEILLKRYQIEEIENQQRKKDLEVSLKETIQSQREVKTIIFTIENQVMQKKREYKLIEKTLNNIKNSLSGIKNKYQGLVKSRQELKNRIKKVEEEIEGIYDDEKLEVINYDDIEIKEEKDKKKMNKLRREISLLEKEIEKLTKEEQDLVQEFKNEQQIRETVGKQLFNTQQDCKKLKEDLQIKQLIVFDENKRYTDMEKKMTNYKNLYEGVKNERNKYVNLIQTTSQDRSDLKEKFKSLNREMQIFRNSLSDKDKIFAKIKSEIAETTKHRDKRKNKLTLCEEKRKKLEDNYNCLANEINKLTGTIKNLDFSVLNICKQNDSLCIQRNQLGQQLISVNSELCYFYDDFNMRKSFFEKLNQKLNQTEKMVSLIFMQLNHNKSRLFIFQQRVLIIPQLANQILERRNKKNELTQQENQISIQLEDLQNKNLKRELGGYNPSETEIDNKIIVMEQVFQEKNEYFLKKEIIIEELGLMVQNFRDQAEQNRRENLKMVSKSNFLKNKLKKLVKKIMMFVSELSIFQAISMKLNKEKSELEIQIKTIQSKVERGDPPTENIELNFLKAVRDQKNFEIQNKERIKLTHQKQFVEPFLLKTTAEKRPNHYVNKLGLPQPFFKIGPFKPQKTTNLKYFKNNFV